MTLEQRRHELTQEAKDEVHRQNIARNRAEVERMLAESGLSHAACERLRRAFGNSTNHDGLKQAINVERRQHLNKQDARVERILGGGRYEQR